MERETSGIPGGYPLQGPFPYALSEADFPGWGTYENSFRQGEYAPNVGPAWQGENMPGMPPATSVPPISTELPVANSPAAHPKTPRY